MRNWKAPEVLSRLLREPNCAAPRSNFNPGAVGITQSGLLMLTESGRRAAADSEAFLSKPVKLRGGAA